MLSAYRLGPHLLELERLEPNEARSLVGGIAAEHWPADGLEGGMCRLRFCLIVITIDPQYTLRLLGNHGPLLGAACTSSPSDLAQLVRLLSWWKEQNRSRAGDGESTPSRRPLLRGKYFTLTFNEMVSLLAR